MMPNFEQQLKQLIKAVRSRSSISGLKVANSHREAAMPLFYWMEYLNQSELTGCCDEMLGGVRSAIVETSACAALGLVRPALLGLRGQIDMALAWLYYKDHRIEWEFVGKTGDGFKLKRDLEEYLDNYIEDFKQRFGLLARHKLRAEAEPYRLLSAHIHGQSSLVLPAFKNLSSVICVEKICLEVAKLQLEVSEYINDIFLSYFASKWASLPNEIMQLAKVRLPEKQLAQLLES
jgi:hypothetical protein